MPNGRRESSIRPPPVQAKASERPRCKPRQANGPACCPRGMTVTVPGGPMKIGITCYPTYGGSGVVATELGIELAARGHEIHFISYAMPIRLSSTHERIYFHE